MIMRGDRICWACQQGGDFKKRAFGNKDTLGGMQAKKEVRKTDGRERYTGR